MDALEKILNKIGEDNLAEREEILGKAREEARRILEQAREAGEASGASAVQAARLQSGDEVQRAVSRTEHDRRRAVLAARNELIGDVIREAERRLRDLPDAEYFDVLKRLALRHAREGQGVLLFSERDLRRMPAGFAQELNSLLSGSGRSVTVGRETIPAGGGFVIRYEDIEQNCTFDALLRDSLEDIRDAAFRALFTDDNE